MSRRGIFVCFYTEAQTEKKGMQTIEIRTTQNVVIEYGLATLTQRFLAHMLDMCVYWLIMLLLTFVFSYLSFMLMDSDWIGVIFIVFQVGGWFFYHLLSEVYNKGQSLGKSALGIRVVRIDGKEPGFSDYLLRTVFQLVDFVLSAGVLGMVLIASSDKRQRFGDMAANTTVVRKQSESAFKLEDILGIRAPEGYEPQYPEVRHLAESDMLMIKTVIERSQDYQNDGHVAALNELVERLRELLGIRNTPPDKIAFLKTLLRDYIILTR